MWKNSKFLTWIQRDTHRRKVILYLPLNPDMLYSYVVLFSDKNRFYFLITCLSLSWIERGAEMNVHRIPILLIYVKRPNDFKVVPIRLQRLCIVIGKGVLWIFFSFIAVPHRSINLDMSRTLDQSWQTKTRPIKIISSLVRKNKLSPQKTRQEQI